MLEENAFHKLLFSSNLYNRSLKEHNKTTLSGINLNIQYGDKGIGNQIFQGKFTFSGYNFDLRDNIPWEQNSPKEWQNEFHSFFWINHLRATNSVAASKFTQMIINKWISEYSKWDEFSWNLLLIAKRLESWSINFNFISEAADTTFLNRFKNSFLRQSKHLLRWSNLYKNNIDRLQIGLTIFLIGVVTNKKKISTKGLKQVEIEIDKSYENKKLFNCSNSSQVLNVLRLLSFFNSINNQTYNFNLKNLEKLIYNSAEIISSLKHNDDAMSIFNGSYEEKEALSQILSNLNLKSKISPLSSINELGFERININRLLLILKTNKFNSSKSYLGPLSFEFSSGKQRLIVNCGTFAGENLEWKNSSLTNHAYSTITINNTNPEFVDEQKYIEPPLRGNEENNTWVELRHHGYRKKFGLIHVRRIHTFYDGMEISGNDSVITLENFDYNKKNVAVLRFHLHPSISASIIGNNKEVLLRINKSQGWLFKVNSSRTKVEESVYMGNRGIMKRSQQILVELDIVAQKHELLWKFIRLPGKNI